MVLQENVTHKKTSSSEDATYLPGTVDHRGYPKCSRTTPRRIPLPLSRGQWGRMLCCKRSCLQLSNFTRGNTYLHQPTTFHAAYGIRIRLSRADRWRARTKHLPTGSTEWSSPFKSHGKQEGTQQIGSDAHTLSTSGRPAERQELGGATHCGNRSSCSTNVHMGGTD